MAHIEEVLGKRYGVKNLKFSEEAKEALELNGAHFNEIPKKKSGPINAIEKAFKGLNITFDRDNNDEVSIGDLRG